MIIITGDSLIDAQSNHFYFTGNAVAFGSDSVLHSSRALCAARLDAVINRFTYIGIDDTVEFPTSPRN